MMKFFRQTILISFLYVSMFAGAQSFDSLRRSSSKPSKLYMAISLALEGKMTLQEAKSAVAEANNLTDAFDGKTPIYLLMDFIATHPTDSCAIAESLVEVFSEREDFDASLRYRDLMPPLTYLIRENYTFLDNSFKKGYISSKVIKLLVKKGASINSYNKDGSSLMSFARETQDTELQDFILGKGIDLTHNAENGKDDIYKVIEEGDVALLKKIISNNNTKVDVTTINNNLDKLVANKEMYETLASHCANHVSNYDELILFLQKFKEKKELVAQKYQEFAKNEMMNAKSFDDVIAISKRYPDATSLIKEHKQYWYKKDCSRLLHSYELLLSHARNGSKEVLPEDDYPTQFIECYGNKYNFDPENKLWIAKESSAYRNTVLAMNIDLTRSYWEQEKASNILDLLINTAVSGTSYRNKFDTQIALYDKKLMESCMTNLSKESSVKEFQSYYTRIKDSATERYKIFTFRLKAQTKAYDDAVAMDTNAKQQYEAERRYKKEVEKARDQELELTIEKMSLPDYTVTQDWTDIRFSDLKTAFVGVFGHNSDRAMKIRFKDHKDGWIGYLKNKKSYIAGGTGIYYNNLVDAIIAEYAYRIYGKIRKKGKK